TLIFLFSLRLRVYIRIRIYTEGKGRITCPTDSRFEADQDRTNIAKTSTLPHDSAPRVTSPAADEGRMQLILDELTALCTSLQRQHSEMVAKFKAQELKIHRLKAIVKLLEDRERVVAEQSGDDAPIKGRNLDEREAAAERVSDDTEEMATVLTSMDAAIVLSGGGVAEVPTGSGSIPTASGSIPTAGPSAAEVPTGSDVVPTAGPIFATVIVVTPYTKRKGKETMVESETPKKKKVQEQIDAQVARELKEQMAREDRRILNKESHGLKSKRGITTWQSSKIENFIPMGSKEEAERFKRKGIRFEQESVKKLKTSSEVPEEVKTPDEVPEEKVHTEGHRSYWKITKLGGSSASYQFFVDLLKHLDKEDLNQLWALVKETLNIRPASSDKEMELWVELKRLYEPDVEDQLWTHTQNMMHAPVEWKLYDSCGVHYVTSKDNEIFMVIEKDYPLRKGLAIVMICYKLQVKNYSHMASDLILKIHKIASSPRQQGD
nr:hypothetical protein [Tanacetum cinerariifolium]